MTLADSSDVSSSSIIEKEEKQSQGGIARAAGLIGLGNIVSRVLGLVREMVIAAEFGTGALTTAFTLASQVPIAVYDLLIGGMLSSALVPVFSEYTTLKDNNRSLWQLVSLILVIVTFILSLVTLLIILLAPYVTVLFASGYDSQVQANITALIRIIAPSIIFLGVSGALMGLLYALKRFTFPAFATAIFNLGIIIGALFISRLFEGDARIVGLTLGLVLGSALQFLLLLPDLRDFSPSFRLSARAIWHHPGLRQITKLYIPVALSVVIANIGIVIDRNLASYTGMIQTVPWMRNATTLIQFPLGLVAAAISLAVLPSLSRLSAVQDWHGYRDTLQMGLRMVLLLIVPATVGLFILAEPIVKLVFERGEFVPYDTYWTAITLRVYLLGLIFAAVDQVLIIAFYSRQDTWTPALVGIVAIGVYLLVALPLVAPFKILGLVFANSMQHFSHAIIMLILLQRYLAGLTGGGMISALSRILLAATGMGVIVSWTAFFSYGLLPGLFGSILAVLLPGMAGLISYVLFVTVLRIEEAQQIASLIRRRFG